jgi:hypothetical protein
MGCRHVGLRLATDEFFVYDSGKLPGYLLLVCRGGKIVAIWSIICKFLCKFIAIFCVHVTFVELLAQISVNQS